MSFIAASYGGKWIDPKTLNPLHEEEPDSPEVRAVRTAMGMETLKAGLQAMVDRQMGL